MKRMNPVRDKPTPAYARLRFRVKTAGIETKSPSRSRVTPTKNIRCPPSMPLVRKSDSHESNGYSTFRRYLHVRLTQPGGSPSSCRLAAPHVQNLMSPQDNPSQDIVIARSAVGLCNELGQSASQLSSSLQWSERP